MVDTPDGVKKQYFLQPGSSVVTQLQHGETVDKYCVTLEVNKKHFKSSQFRLQTVRPFVMSDIMVAEVLENKPPNPARALELYCETRIESLILEANEKLNGHPDQPIIPVIRIRVFHSNETEMFNPVRFSQKFAGKVANDDIVMFKKLTSKSDKIGDMDIRDLQDMIIDEAEVFLIKKYFDLFLFL